MLKYLLLRGGDQDPPLASLFDGWAPQNVSFARASGGTRTDRSRRLCLEAVNVPRFEYDPLSGVLRGLLIEPQRTNSADEPDVDLWGDLNLTTEASSVTGPDRVRTLALMTALNTSGDRAQRTISGLTVGEIYTLSFYAKPADTLYAGVVAANAAAAGGSYFMDGAGSVANSAGSSLVSAGIAAAMDGLYRIALSFRATAASNLWAGIGVGSTVFVSTIYPRAAAGSRCLAGFPQLELGAQASSYIPTFGVAASRAADALSFTLPEGTTGLRYVFDDGSTQDVAVVAGAYTVPVDLARPVIRSILRL